mgnify:CR=1 FL=1
MPMPGPRSDKALLGEDNRDRLIEHLRRGLKRSRLFDKRPAVIPIGLRVRLDFARHRSGKTPVRREKPRQALLFIPARLKFRLDLSLRQPGELPQLDFQNVLSLTLREAEASQSVGLRLIALPDHRDHFIHVKQRDGAAFENMDSVLHLRKARFRSAADRRNSERHPLGKNLKKRFLAGFPVTPDHHKIHRRVALETRLREERCNKGVPIDFRRLRLKNDAAPARFYPTSSRTWERSASIALFVCCCSGVSVFFPAFGRGS